MTDAEIVDRLSPVQTVALTLFGEARNEPIEGRIAVANVIRNRVLADRPAWGLGYKGVCLKAWQFSTWLPAGGQDNYETLMWVAGELLQPSDAAFPERSVRECLWIAEGLIADQFRDTVKHATHYYSPTAMKPAGRVPAWALGLLPVATIGRHVFFSGVR